MNCIFVWEKNWNLAWKETPRAWPWFLRSYCHTHTLSSFFFFLNSFSVAPINQIFSSHKLSAALYEFRVPESIELGSAVGVIRAMDADIGQNAEMDYRIIGSDGPGMFEITTNRSTQEGVILLRKVRHSLREVLWDHMSSFNTFTLIYSPKKSKLCLQNYESSLIEILTWLLCCSFYSSKNHKQQARLCYLFALGFACQAAITLWLVENYMSLRLPQRQPCRHKPGKNSGKHFCLLHIFH